MPSSNHLEQLVAEWYEFRGYFVRRNIKVGRRDRGGYQGELDVVAFHPTKRHLVQIECSTDTKSLANRKSKFKKKFEIGSKYIPSLFSGFNLPEEIQQIGLFLHGGKHEQIANGKMQMVSELIVEIVEGLKDSDIKSRIVPESFPLLRTLQLVSHFRKHIKHWNEVY